MQTVDMNIYLKRSLWLFLLNLKNANFTVDFLHAGCNVTSANNINNETKKFYAYLLATWYNSKR